MNSNGFDCSWLGDSRAECTGAAPWLSLDSVAVDERCSPVHSLRQVGWRRLRRRFAFGLQAVRCYSWQVFQHLLGPRWRGLRRSEALEPWRPVAVCEFGEVDWNPRRRVGYR